MKTRSKWNELRRIVLRIPANRNRLASVATLTFLSVSQRLRQRNVSVKATLENQYLLVSLWF
jgi:hypothetical protein